MARAPKPEATFIAWSRLHANLWTSGPPGGGPPPDVGIDEQQLLATLAACAKAEAAHTAMRKARSAAKAATRAKDHALAELRAAMGADVSIIDAYAKATKDPGVWVRAQIPAPKDASERDAPPAPIFTEVVQKSGGVMRLDFTVTTGGGAQYLLQRRDTTLDGVTTEWFPTATLTEKGYEDRAIPLGLRGVEYRVRAQLSSGAASGWSNTVGFSFGSLGSQGGPLAQRRSAV